MRLIVLCTKAGRSCSTQVRQAPGCAAEHDSALTSDSPSPRQASATHEFGATGVPSKAQTICSSGKPRSGQAAQGLPSCGVGVVVGVDGVLSESGGVGSAGGGASTGQNSALASAMPSLRHMSATHQLGATGLPSEAHTTSPEDKAGSAHDAQARYSSYGDVSGGPLPGGVASEDVDSEGGGGGSGQPGVLHIRKASRILPRSSLKVHVRVPCVASSRPYPWRSMHPPFEYAFHPESNGITKSG